MKRFLLICIYLFVYFSIDAQSIGDSLFQAGKYFEAAVQYEKEAYFHPEYQSEMLLKKAYCYKALGKYDQALQITKRINRINNDSLGRLVMYERIFLSYLLEDFPQAYNQLVQWDFKIQSKDESVEILRFLTLISLEKMEEARVLLEKQGDLYGMERAQVEEILSMNWKLKDPQKAYNLSLFFPGVGQMYAGYFFRGLFSGGLQTVIVAFTAYSFYKGYFFSGAIPGAALFYTFYLGGARYARQLSEKRNSEIKSKLKESFLERIKK